MLASARAFVFYFNTERSAVYCVLYVFLFILYNTVFFITQPWLQEAAAIRSDRLSHDEYDETTWSARTWTTFAAQRISVALQRSAALEILQSLRMGPVEGRDLY